MIDEYATVRKVDIVVGMSQRCMDGCLEWWTTNETYRVYDSTWQQLCATTRVL